MRKGLLVAPPNGFKRNDTGIRKPLINIFRINHGKKKFLLIAAPAGLFVPWSKDKVCHSHILILVLKFCL